jgi:hypothetical protein
MLNRQNNFSSNATAEEFFYEANEDGKRHICMSTSCASSLNNCSVLVDEDIDTKTTR